MMFDMWTVLTPRAAWTPQSRSPTCVSVHCSSVWRSGPGERDRNAVRHCSVSARVEQAYGPAPGRTTQSNTWGFSPVIIRIAWPLPRRDINEWTSSWLTVTSCFLVSSDAMLMLGLATVHYTEWVFIVIIQDAKQRLTKLIQSSEEVPLIRTTSPDSLNKCGDFKSCWVKTNFTNSVKLCLWQTLHYLDLLENSANVLHELLPVFE